jgi:hypothetical protein
LTIFAIAAASLSLPNLCPDTDSILNAVAILQAREWSRTSWTDIENLWPQTLEQEGTCSSCISVSSLAFFGEDCAAASFTFGPDEGRSLRDLRIMVPASSEKTARDFAERTIRIVGPPSDSLVVSESDPWIRYYTWSSREDCGPNPKGCIVSTVEIGYRRFPDESFWTLIVDWKRFLLD